MAELKKLGRAFILILVTVIATLWGDSIIAKNDKVANSASVDDVNKVKSELVVYTDGKCAKTIEYIDKSKAESIKHTDDVMEAHNREALIEKEKNNRMYNMVEALYQKEFNR